MAPCRLRRRCGDDGDRRVRRAYVFHFDALALELLVILEKAFQHQQAMRRQIARLHVSAELRVVGGHGDHFVVARAIGLMTTIDSGASDDKVIAVATNVPEFSGYVEARDLPPHRLLVLKRFFQDYKQLEGKRVEVEDIRPAYAAVTVIERALARYQQEREKLIAKEGR